MSTTDKTSVDRIYDVYSKTSKSVLPRDYIGFIILERTPNINIIADIFCNWHTAKYCKLSLEHLDQFQNEFDKTCFEFYGTFSDPYGNSMDLQIYHEMYDLLIKDEMLDLIKDEMFLCAKN